MNPVFSKLVIVVLVVAGLLLAVRGGNAWCRIAGWPIGDAIVARKAVRADGSHVLVVNFGKHTMTCEVSDLYYRRAEVGQLVPIRERPTLLGRERFIEERFIVSK